MPVDPPHRLHPILLALVLAQPAGALHGTAPAAATPGAPRAALEDVEAGPWQLHSALGLPDWLEVGGAVRARFEHLDERYRLGRDGHDRIFVLRSLFAMTIRDEFLSVSAEVQDSRAYDVPDDSLLGTSTVNAVEPLQWYVAGEWSDALRRGDELDVLVGRHTMDVGSRRLVARNRYRNTINSFLGANAEWRSEDGTYARVFYTHPTIRLPSALDQDALRDNEVEFDEERSRNRFWGAFASRSGLALETTAEAYYYGLERADVVGLAVADRRLHTVGARWYRPRRKGRLFWELESAYQFGRSRATSTALEDLDHDALFGHASLGYAFDADWSPQIEGLFDYASGDEDPEDGANNRFDTLFGARRFEFGPTGIFGAFARSNLVTPGVRVLARPGENWQLMFTQRLHYLASDRDAWVTAGLRDPAGASGRHIGDLTELRVRYELAPDSIGLEVGAAYLSAGGFIDSVGDGRDSLYTYVQTTFTF